MNSTNKNNASSTAAKEKQSFFRSNPVINRLNKVEERAGYDEKAAGYGRITIKTAFFLLVTVAGMMAYLVMNATIFANQPQELAFNYFPRLQDRLSLLPARFTRSARAS